ncbi:hypothetical protein PQO01_04245 [Lentisphaera marina]|uniref:efflux RND transporter periplasmic adaptor subunit n=1 Tax=Lentisphaera marina TaxID=1111041 RepID=UPI002366AD44|nr:hypothetical protein [Lentisphaera marina]MDD7984163.1 hypothetical protein [Lentisphaera marina]
MKYLSISFIILLAFSSYATEDTWDAHKHPAKLTRVITGFTEPCKSLDVKAEYPSRLISYEAQEGQILDGPKDRILIAKQDTSLIELELKATQAALKSQKQTLKTQEARALLEKRNVKYRKLEMDRISLLSDDGKIAKSNFDRVLYEFDQAELQLIEVNQNIALQKQKIIEAEVATELVKEKLSRHYIYGPKGWLLNTQISEVGAWLNANEIICQVVDLRQLSVNFRLSQEEYEVLKANEIQLKYKEKTLKSKLHRSDRNYDPVSRKRHVELRIDSQELSDAAGGLEVKLELMVDYPSPALMVPNSFVHTGLEQTWLINSKGEKIIFQALRRIKGFYIIKKSIIPENTILIKAK